MFSISLCGISQWLFLYIYTYIYNVLYYLMNVHVHGTGTVTHIDNTVCCTERNFILQMTKVQTSHCYPPKLTQFRRYSDKYSEMYPCQKTLNKCKYVNLQGYLWPVWIGRLCRKICLSLHTKNFFRNFIKSPEIRLYSWFSDSFETQTDVSVCVLS